MLGPKFLIISKKYLIVLVLIILVAAIFPLYSSRGPDLPPHEMIAKALSESSKAQTYRYHTEANLEVNGNREVLSKVEGEKAGPEQIHVKGSIMKSSIEIYQINEITYTKDSFTDRWIVLKGNTLQQQELFMTELNPLANFAYKEIFEVKYEGTEEVNGSRTWVYTVSPQVSSAFLEMFWTNITFKMWVGTDHLLKKALIKAESKKDRRDNLQIKVEMFDYNKKINITPPRVKPLGQP